MRTNAFLVRAISIRLLRANAIRPFVVVCAISRGGELKKKNSSVSNRRRFCLSLFKRKQNSIDRANSQRRFKPTRVSYTDIVDVFFFPPDRLGISPNRPSLQKGRGTTKRGKLSFLFLPPRTRAACYISSPSGAKSRIRTGEPRKLYPTLCRKRRKVSIIAG